MQSIIIIQTYNICYIITYTLFKFLVYLGRQKLHLREVKHRYNCRKMHKISECRINFL